MAMTICKECKNQISDTAKLCPHCGALYTKKIGTNDILDGSGVFSIFLGIALLIWTNFLIVPIILIGYGVFTLSFASFSKTK